MRKTLGLDLGTNSIGWAITDSDTPKIIEMGTTIFQSDREIQRSSKRSSRRNTKKDSLSARISAIAYHAATANKILPFLLHGFLAMLFTSSILMAITTKDFQFWFNLAITILLGWIALRK